MFYVFTYEQTEFFNNNNNNNELSTLIPFCVSSFEQIAFLSAIKHIPNGIKGTEAFFFSFSFW